MKIPVEPAAKIASDLGLELVVIAGYDGNSLEVASYGKSPMGKDMAAEWADRIPESIGFDPNSREMNEDYRATPEAVNKHRFDIALLALQEIASIVPTATSFDGSPVVALLECWQIQEIARRAVERLKG